MDGLPNVLSGPFAERYTIERELGRGATATVYLARDDRGDRLVAIKVLKPELAESIGVDRFLREIRLTQRLHHPHILEVLDSGEHRGMLYFVLPLMEGGTLRQRLEREQQLPIDEAVAITRTVANALAYAHEQGLVHRDVKPENILFSSGEVCLADFGIARAIERSSDDPTTSTGVIRGTPTYMSPEQASGERHYDGRSDIYSLACVLYEMVAGMPAFIGPTPKAVMAQRFFHAPRPVTVYRQTAPPFLEAVLQRALQLEPVDRYRTAAEFGEALAGEHHGSSGSGDVQTYPPATTKRRGTRRWRVVAGGALVVVSSAAAIILGAGNGLLGSREGITPVTALEPQRIAVLYFEDESPNSTLGPVAASITESLISDLSGVNAFRVVSRNGVRPYRDRRTPFDSMVTALRVNTVVDGSVQAVGSKLRVTVQLIDAGSNTFVDTVSLERPATDRALIERELALQVAAALRRRVGRVARSRQAILGTTSAQAKTLVLKAQREREDAEALSMRAHPEDRRTALESLRRADSLLSLAQQADSQWLRPLLDRGWVAQQRFRLDTGQNQLRAVDKGIQYADESVRRSPANAEALELRGTLGWRRATEQADSAGDALRLVNAEQDLRAALDRDSTLATAWATLSFLLRYKGHFAEADIYAQRALREDASLENSRDVFVQLFYSSLMLGETGKAGEWCQRGRFSFPADWYFVECQLTLMRHDLHSTPDPQRAWALVDQLDQIDPAATATAAGRPYNPIYRRVVAATISARAGRRDIARAELARARRATAGDWELQRDLVYDEAYLRIVLGERKRATELVREMLRARPMLRPFLARDPLFRDFPLPN